jgi:hypothetical protein
MIQLIAVLVTALSPILFVVVLLVLAGWREQWLEAERARQIRLTDAIAEEMGAIVAPVVRKRWGAGWRIEMAVPLGRPALVGRILSVAHRTLERMGPARYEIVLTPQGLAPESALKPAVAGPRLRVA